MYIMKNVSAHKVYLVIAFVLIFCATCFSGCINENTAVQTDQKVYEWMDTEMTNVVTKETFTLHELTQDGTPVVVHLIATWCPACNMQFRESTTFLETNPGKAHIVLIGIDASENSTKIADYVSSKGYSGIFTTAEAPVIQGLMDLFGQEIVMSIPQTVIISGNSLAYLGPGAITSANIASRIDTISQQVGK